MKQKKFIGCIFGYKIEERKTKTTVLKLPKDVIEFLKGIDSWKK